MIKLCDHTQDMLDLADALAQLTALPAPPLDDCLVPLAQAVGRVSSQAIHSPLSLPAHPSSSMDGYAYSSQNDHTQLTLQGQVLAGHPYTQKVPLGSCVSITTGAQLPEGCDTVEMQEKVQQQDKQVQLPGIARSGQFVRPAGGEVARNQQLINKNTLLTARHIALLASVGIHQIQVKRPLRIALVSTGDELQAPGKALQPGQIYDANGSALQALLGSFTALKLLPLVHVPDCLTQTQQALQVAAEQSDLVLTCGGVSVGQADYIKQSVHNLGQLALWKVAIKPGKPFAFGYIGDAPEQQTIHQHKHAYFCGLPGNPVSAFVTAQQLLLPLIYYWLTGERPVMPTLSARLSDSLSKQPGRMDFQRGHYWQDAQGNYHVAPLRSQNSAMLTTLADANCYLLLPRQQGDLPTGSQVSIQPFSPFTQPG